ncbi:MAG: transcription antitermination factor NusB [Alphaproteobacteria bacterium 41-28]|nr:MAG: transcription antitermination factor NusB [Alphaproteobacteria bacterium 41-28]
MSKAPSPKTPFKGRTVGRLVAVQALFQIEQTGSSASSVVLEFLNHRLKDTQKGRRQVDTTFFVKLTEGAWSTHHRSDEVICGALKEGWPLDRIESVTRAILRAALYEILESNTPTAVIIDEYLNITHDFFDDKEVAFVNGVLNAVAKKIRQVP